MSSTPVLEMKIRAVRPGHLHRQPRHHRRDDGQQLEAGRSAIGAFSRQDHRPRHLEQTRGAVRWLVRRPLQAARALTRLDTICRGRVARGGLLPRRCAPVAGECAGEVERRYPKILRRVGGYNLDCFVQPGQPFNLAKLMVGSEGTLGVVLEAKVALVPLPKAKCRPCDPVPPTHTQGARSGHTDDLWPHGPSAVEVDGPVTSSTTRKQSPGVFLEAPPPYLHRGRPGSAALRGALCGPRRGSAAPSRRARARSPTSGASATGITAPWIWPRRHPSGGCARPRWGCRWPRRTRPRRSRSSRTPRWRPNGCATTSTVSSPSSAATARPPACTRTRRSAVCTSGPWST